MSCCSMECSPGWNAIHDLFSNSCQVRDEKFKSHQSHLSETWQNTDFTDVYNTFLVDIFVDRIMFDTCWTIIIPYLWLELYRIDRLLISYLMHRSQQWVWTMRIDVTEASLSVFSINWISIINCWVPAAQAPVYIPHFEEILNFMKI